MDDNIKNFKLKRMLLINTQEKFSAVPEKWVWTFRGFEGTWSWETTKLSLIHKWFIRYWLLRNHGFHSQIGWDFLGHDSNDTADLRSSKVSENASITARYFESPNISSDCISPCLLWSSSLDLFSGVTLFLTLSNCYLNARSDFLLLALLIAISSAKNTYRRKIWSDPVPVVFEEILCYLEG